MKNTIRIDLSAKILLLWFTSSASHQLSHLTRTLNCEQQQICWNASGTSLFSTRLQQRLFIFKRYFIALNRSPFEQISARKFSTETGGDSKEITKVPKTITKTPANPMASLARVGSMAALNFSFAFLRKAWRLGTLKKF